MENLFFRASTLSAPSNVNVELETSVLFEPEDTEKHLTFIHSVRDVLDKLENAIQPKFRYRSLSTHEPTRKPDEQETIMKSANTKKLANAVSDLLKTVHKYKPTRKTTNYKPETIVQSANTRILTNFVKDLLKTISKYHEIDIQIFFTFLNSEMTTHFYKGSVFREMVYDPKLQTYIQKKLKQWASTDSGVMKRRLLTHVNRSENTDAVLDTIGGLNAYFDSKNEVKMRAILHELAKPRHHLANIIKEAIDYFIFEHYDKMNYTLRAKFADEVNKLAVLVRKTNIHQTLNDNKDSKLTSRRTSGVGETKETKNGVEDVFEPIGNDIDDDKVIENGNAKYIDKEMNYDLKSSDARRYDEKNVKKNIEDDKDEVLMKTERVIQDMVESVSKKMGDVSVGTENQEEINSTIIIDSKEKNEDAVGKQTKEIIKKEISLSKERDKYDTNDTIKTNEIINRKEVIRNVSKEKDVVAVNKNTTERNANAINKESKGKDPLSTESKERDGHDINKESKSKDIIDKESKERDDIFKESIKEYKDAINKDNTEKDKHAIHKESKEKYEYVINKENEEKDKHATDEESKEKYVDAISKGSSERDEAARNKDSNEKDKYSINEDSEEKYEKDVNGLSIPVGTDDVSNSD